MCKGFSAVQVYFLFFIAVGCFVNMLTEFFHMRLYSTSYIFRYPEETNNCCLYLSVSEERTVKFDVQTKQSAHLSKPMTVNKIDREKNTIITNVENSIWIVQVFYENNNFYESIND